ncbi:CRISPR-associated endonuclease Cas2 [Actinomadura sp. CNU-125]|uniref:CRISPR-associated endonuclease Cas2 n=1 Tax=Actinomadura sp. CNU-125 TaxID=1904961 RepID=UPI001177367E|nr:CRISPR-associated endonuclease Cas2 [Actinomadura sp. CNU-125]
MKAPIVVCYDVYDDVRRARLREALSGIADRFQQSGWLVPSHPPGPGLGAEQLATLLSGPLHPIDRLRLYAPCPACRQRARTLPTTSREILLPRAAWIAH